MGSEKAWHRWSRFLHTLGAHLVLDGDAKESAEVAAMDDAADRQYSDKSHHVLSSDTESKADCHHNASSKTCTDHMP
jgi:hypothetical protein